MRHSPDDQQSTYADAQSAYASLSAETRDKLLEWITSTIAPATCIYPYSSYSMKADAEAAVGTYIGNDEFKGAIGVLAQHGAELIEMSEDAIEGSVGRVLGAGIV
jgi:hypothetical protein